MTSLDQRGVRSKMHYLGLEHVIAGEKFSVALCSALAIEDDLISRWCSLKGTGIFLGLNFLEIFLDLKEVFQDK